MLLLAASALEKAAKVPTMFWLKVVLAIIGFLLLVVIARKVMETNKVILLAITVVVVGVLGFQCIYERNEPAFLTPVVDAIAPFFPSKGAYEVRQQSEPDKPGLKKSAPTNSKTPAPQKK
jgi:hypothetical protein